MKSYLTEVDLKFIPLYNSTELLKLGNGNSSFEIYENHITIYAIYPFTLMRTLTLKTKGKNYLIKVVDAKQCGQNDFEAILKLDNEDSSLEKLILQNLTDFHS